MQKDIDEVVAAIKEEMRLYDADKEDRQLRSYEIQVFLLCILLVRVFLIS